MKAEKVLGIAACVFACATGSTFASATNDWFSATVSDATLTLSNVTTNDAAVTVADSKIKFEDIESSAPFTFTPGNDNTATTKGDGIVVISTTADLTPCMTNDLATTEVTGAAAGFAIGVDDDDAANTNFYGYANGAWERLAGATPDYEGANTAFKIIINYRDSKVSFSAGGTDLHSATNNDLTAFAIDSGKTALNNVAAFGSGAIASLSAGCEQAVAAVVDGTTKRYGTIAEAIAAAGNDQTKIAVVDSNGTTGTANELAANGLPKWECAALGVAESASLALAPSDKAVANKITLKLTEANQPAPGVTATFGVNDGSSTTGSYAPDCIEIPLTTGTYTIVPTVTAAP